jgi:hypothetical protein
MFLHGETACIEKCQDLTLKRQIADIKPAYSLVVLQQISAPLSPACVMMISFCQRQNIFATLESNAEPCTGRRLTSIFAFSAIV